MNSGIDFKGITGCCENCKSRFQFAGLSMFLPDHIHKLELSLLEPKSRRSTEHLDEVLAEEFIEFGSSGRIYTKKAILEHLPDDTPKTFLVENFKISELSDDVVLATYEATIDGKHSLRSSIWKLYENTWKMVFHQGTKCAIDSPLGEYE